MSLPIGDKHVVSFHYELTDSEGNKLESSEGQEPLSYLHGSSNIIPGLENALAGRVAGDTLSVTVAPSDAYGEVQAELIQTVPHEAFQGIDRVEPGMAFNAAGPGGAQQRVVVTSVDDQGVTVDGNHPLAGVTLTFDVEVVSVRDASDEEIAHGHAH